MHCDACKTLIKMELEEAGLAKYVAAISVGENNQGEAILTENVSGKDVETIKQVINKMKKYSVN